MSVPNEFMSSEMRPSFFKKPNILDWSFAALLVAGSDWFVTLFAFLGVNMFLSGLHSYGEL